MPRFVSAILCLVALAAADAGQAANPAFRISIDADTWRKFGWRYPVTYVFHLPAAVQELKVRRRDGSGDPWTPLACEPRGEPLGGVECFRLDPEAKRVYVSVGFKSSPTIHLEFSGTEKVDFVEIARHYDGPKAFPTIRRRFDV